MYIGALETNNFLRFVLCCAVHCDVYTRTIETPCGFGLEIIGELESVSFCLYLLSVKIHSVAIPKKNMDFDAVLPDVGSFGVYQKLVIIFVLLPALIPCAFHAYSQLFIAARQDHWCRVAELEGIHIEIAKNASIPRIFRDGQLRFSQCTMYDQNYTRIAELLKQGYMVEPPSIDAVLPCTMWHYDTTIFTSSVASQWDLVCEKDFYVTLALVLFAAGGLIGNYIFGYMQDSWGRRPSFYCYLIIEIAACALSAFTTNFIPWLLLRIVVGFTVPAILASPYVLAIELVGPEKRSFCTLITNIAYSVGLVLLAGIVYFVRDWRYLSLAVSLPLLFLFTCYPFLPESPRWLVAIGKYKKAAKIMAQIAQVNGKKLPANYGEILKSKVEQPECLEPHGIHDLFATKNMCHKTLIITFIWFANTSVYVGLSYYAPALGGDEIWNFFLAGAVELPTYIFLWPAMHVYGRRWVLCVSMIVGGLACLATFLTQHNQAVTLFLYCVGKMGISSAFVVLPLAASEIYPTVVRGLGMSLSSVVGMIGPIIIPIINYMVSLFLILTYIPSSFTSFNYLVNHSILYS